MPTLIEQLNSVFAAPIPWFIALVAIAAGTWRTFEWRYKAVFEKQAELYNLSRSEVDHWKDLAERTTEELTQRIGSLQKKNEEETKELERLAARLSGELNRLGQANSSVLSIGFIPGTQIRHTGGAPPADMDWTSSGWKPRNPTDVTGGSG